MTSTKFFDEFSLVVTRGQLVVTRGHSWSLVVTRGHSCVLLDTTMAFPRTKFEKLSHNAMRYSANQCTGEIEKRLPFQPIQLL